MRALHRSIRALVRDKAFTAMSVVMLALGIGATASIYSVVRAVVLESSFADPESLFAVEEIVPDFAGRFPSDAFPVNARHFDRWREACAACSGMGLVGPPGGANLTGEGAPERMRIVAVTHDLLPTLGVVPLHGRLFVAGDDLPGASPVLLLAEAFWRRRFHADPGIVGKEIRLNGSPRTVIGVLPGDFEGLAGDYLAEWRLFSRDFDALAPLRLRFDAVRGTGNFNYGAVVRLRPGASSEQAADQMNGALATFVEEFDRAMSVRLVPIGQALLGKTETSLWLLASAVGALLAIVCLNVAGLTAVRFQRRRREAAVRRALGASTGRLAGQALIEGLVVSAIGGAAGLIIAYWAVDAILAAAPADMPRLAQARLDWGVAVFAVAATFLAGLFASAAPALQFATVPVEASLREGQSTATASKDRGRSRDLLVAVEVALCAVLLATAGLVGSGLHRLLSVDRGFVARNVLSFDLVLSPNDYPFRDGSRVRFHDALIERIHSVPGVEHVGVTTRIPLEGSAWMDSVTPAEVSLPREERPPTEFRFVAADYWRAMGIRLVAGRFLERTDADRKHAVVSQSVARKLWPGDNAIGKRFRGGPGNGEPWEVVGVVDDVRTVGLHADAASIIYVPYWMLPLDAVSYAVRTQGDPVALVPALRDAVWTVDPTVPFTNARTLTQVVTDSVAQERFQTLLAGLFAAFALLLASLGVYGVVAYVVARRTGEIGLRMALGAEAPRVRRLVLRQGMRPVLAGLVVGLVAALAFRRTLETLLFAEDGYDPYVFAVVGAVLISSSFAACWIPARRAARIDPAAALKTE